MNVKGSITYEPQNTQDLTTFLENNKEKYYEIWIIITKKKFSNPQPVSFDEAVTLAIAKGLVDNRTKSLDNKKYKIRFTKRKKEKISI
jgi:uncharacterized protein YdeI (YjbR/CyaY-like superfamily)